MADAPQWGGHGKGREGGHVSVLLNEVIDFLKIQRGGTYIDATLGAGGHSYEIAKRLGRQGKLLGFDKDAGALAIARRRVLEPPPALAEDWPQVTLVHGSFAEVLQHMAESPAQGPPTSGLLADGLVADLGLSSLQLADAKRGFSFQAEGPLDMRMDARAGLTADQVVNQFDEEELAGLIYEFGEERRSRRIARAIVRARPVKTTAHLAKVISAAARPMKTKRHTIHPATLTFQAIRIYVNRELEDLKILLQDTPQILRSGGRGVFISFHSLEDRAVKDAFRAGERNGVYQVLTRKPVTAGEEEIRNNPRSRSAKLRAVQRI